MKIYVIRHGQTEWNKLQLLQGSTDIELSTNGIEQANKLANRLKRCKIEQIYSSPLSRALYTAKAIQQNTNSPIILRDDLKEITLGEWEGHTFEEVQNDYADAFYKWENEPWFDIGNGIENYQHLQDRAYHALIDIVKDDLSEILISTHGAWIIALVCKILHIPLEHRLNFEIGNTSLNILEYNSLNKQFKLLTLNEMLHLD